LPPLIQPFQHGAVKNTHGVFERDAVLGGVGGVLVFIPFKLFIVYTICIYRECSADLGLRQIRGFSFHT
jgi:hypothetical protein